MPSTTEGVLLSLRGEPQPAAIWLNRPSAGQGANWENRLRNPLLRLE
jgi:hypothetical protein